MFAFGEGREPFSLYADATGQIYLEGGGAWHTDTVMCIRCKRTYEPGAALDEARTPLNEGRWE